MGGDCLNVGCVPSKALIAARRARSRHPRRAARFGDRPQRCPGRHGARARPCPRRDRGDRARTIPAERFAALGVRVIKAEARFTGPRHRRGGRGRRSGAPLRPRHRLAPFRAADPGPRPGAVPHQRDASSIFAGGRSGSSSSAAGRSGRSWRRPTAASAPRSRSSRPRRAPAPRRPRDGGGASSARSSRTGSSSTPGSAIEQIEQRDDRVVVVLRSGDAPMTVEGSHLLVAAGRQPVTDGLGLEAAGDRRTTGAASSSTRGLRTTNRRVYAIGDCAGAGRRPVQVHPRRELPRRSRDPQRPLPAAGEGRHAARSRA